MFGTEARIPSEIIIGKPPFENSPSAYALSHCKILEKSFENVRENLSASQKHMMDYYELGTNERTFQKGDKVRIRIKSLALKPGSKLRSPWSDLFEVVSVTGSVIEIRNPSNNEIVRVHADRLSNVTPDLRPETKTFNYVIDPEDIDFNNFSTITTNVPNNSVIITTNKPTNSNYTNPTATSSRINKSNKNNDNLSSDSEEFDDTIDFSRSPHKRLIKPSQKKDFVYGFMLFSSNLTTASVTIPLTMSERKESVSNPGGALQGKTSDFSRTTKVN